MLASVGVQSGTVKLQKPVLRKRMKTMTTAYLYAGAHGFTDRSQAPAATHPPDAATDDQSIIIKHTEVDFFLAARALRHDGSK